MTVPDWVVVLSLLAICGIGLVAWLLKVFGDGDWWP
jgi:hypothetical protein